MSNEKKNKYIMMQNCASVNLFLGMCVVCLCLYHLGNSALLQFNEDKQTHSDQLNSLLKCSIFFFEEFDASKWAHSVKMASHKCRCNSIFTDVCLLVGH